MKNAIASMGSHPNVYCGWQKTVILALISLALCAQVSAATVDVMLKNARMELGRGEQFGNNCGPDVMRYLDGRQNLPWCAGFVSYVLRESGYKIPYLLRAKSFLKYGVYTKFANLSRKILLFGFFQISISRTITLFTIFNFNTLRMNFTTKNIIPNLFQKIKPITTRLLFLHLNPPLYRQYYTPKLCICQEKFLMID